MLLSAWSADIVGVSQGNVSLESIEGRLRFNTPDLNFANLATATKRKGITTTTTTTTSTTPLPPGMNNNIILQFLLERKSKPFGLTLVPR